MSKSATVKDRVLKRVVKTPRSGVEIAKLEKLKDYRSCSRILGSAHHAGVIKHGADGYYR